MNQRVYVAIQLGLFLLNLGIAVQAMRAGKQIWLQIFACIIIAAFIIFGTNWSKFWRGY